MLEYVFFALLGCGIGAVTGLTPGVHVNTVCLIGLGLYSLLGLDAIEFGVFMVAVSLTHTFLDFIPGIFLGVPEEGTALSILPAHRLLLSGRALEAVKLTCYGCLLGLVFSLALLAPVLYVVPVVYHQIRGYIVYVISFSAAVLIFRENGWGKLFAASVFFVSGWLGVLALGMEGMSATYVLFPVFSGLFGLSGMLFSLKETQTNIPQQTYVRTTVDGEVIRGGFLGAFGGAVVGLLPAMSPSQIGILASDVFGSSDRSFLVSVAAIQTSDSIYSLVSLYTIGNARSGVSVMLGRIICLNIESLCLFVGVFCLIAFVAAYLHLKVGKIAAVYYGSVDYRLLTYFVMTFVLVLVYAFAGLFGLLLASVSTAIGLLPIMTGVSRTHLMGVLLLPTIMYFAGIG